MNRRFALLAAGLATFTADIAGGVAPVVPTATSAEDFLVVDCLLPGQVRQLGMRTIYLSARRPARLPAVECRIRGGEYVSYDRADARNALGVWLPSAEKGDLEAALLVGEIYERGIGVQPDYALAARWYRTAADGGNARAQINLGNLYERGRGVPGDLHTALEWYRRAAGKNAEIELDPTPSAPVNRQGEIKALEQQLAAKDREIETLSAALAGSRQEVAAVTAQNASEAQTRAQRDNDLAVMRNEQRRLAADLAAARSLADQQRAMLVAAATQVRTQAQQLDALKQPIEQKLLSGPSLALIDPPLVAARDILSVAISNSGERLIVGRVTAPAGLLSLTLNDQDIVANERGIFSHRLTVSAAPLPIKVVAVDQQGKRSELRFTLRPTDTPGLSAAASTVPGAAPPIDFGRYHALVIGINDYQSLPKLTTPAADAAAIASLLQSRYGFQVTLLTNATRYQLLSALNKLRETLTADDNLLLYYAGHGELDEVNQRGNWLPVDAERDNTANWIPTTVITDILNIMRAKQVLVVADSCYSGAMTRSAVARLRSGMTDAERGFWMRTMSHKRARLVLSSGGLTPVMDEGGGKNSVFARAFLDVLTANNEPIDGQRLHREVAARVAYAAANLSFDQVPEYAPIRFAGHEAGEFFLVPR